MKAFFLGFVLLLSQTSKVAFAANPEKVYSFSVELALNNEPPMKASIVSTLGREVAITEEIDGKKRFIEFIATPVTKSGSNSLHFQFVVGTVDRNGERHVQATPQIITDRTSIANMTSSNKDETEKVSVSVSWKPVQD